MSSGNFGPGKMKKRS